MLEKNFEDCIRTVVHYKSTREALLIHKLLQVNWGGCVGKEEHYRSTGETVLVEYFRNTVEAVLIRRLLLEHSGSRV